MFDDPKPPINKVRLTKRNQPWIKTLLHTVLKFHVDRRAQIFGGKVTSNNKAFVFVCDDMVALLVGHWICDLQVVGSAPAGHHCIVALGKLLTPLSPSSILW